MSCGCSSGSGYDGGIYGGVCDTDTPYPSVSHESVPSLIDNLVYALYGAITKDVTSGKVVWNIPCDPSNIPATINGIPRNEGEGLLCYIVRALNLTTPSGFVTVNGVQTLTNKTLDASCSLLGNAATATAAINIAGGLAGSIPYQTGVGLTALLPQGTAGQVLSTNGSGGLGWITNSATSSATNNINGGTAGVVVYQTGVNTTGFTAAGTSGQVLVSNGTSAPTWITPASTNTASAIVKRDASGDFSAGTITASFTGNITGAGNSSFAGNVGIGTTSPTADLQITDGTRSLRIDANLNPTGNTYISASGSTDGLIIGTTDSKSVSFFTNNTLRASVESNGTINTQGNPITNCPTTAKAWGGASSTGVIESVTFGVSTITRSALGNYLVTMSTAINGYSIVATPNTSGGNQATAQVVSTTQFRVYTFGGAGAATDTAFKFAVFGV